ncbi:MAG: quinone-dependent dihydroorotate dehydrogenase [Gammaproteobacteria bacterium]|nr:quinone-dependent dihydroorotate dehydrogenase [Gammaproteobacteria bacterium]
MYSLIRKILFLFDAETIHVFSLKMLNLANSAGLLRLFLGKRIDSPVTVMGLTFPNAVGLAAGLDKNGCYIDALANCGFGFIEVGTVTPLAQPGNDKPRLFRLPADNAIINRMGFNNAGVGTLIANVQRSQHPCIIGINIGKNKSTPLENAVDDYLICMQQVYPYADYIAINVSSPNTPGLRELQHGESLSLLLTRLKSEQATLERKFHRYVPLAVKIAPDLDDGEIQDIAKRLMAARIDAVIATNTSSSRPGSLRCTDIAKQAGGLSGQPVFDLSTHVLRVLVKALNGRIPVIAVGGITTVKQAQQKIEAGASLVQIYTGFVYSGPKLVNECARLLSPRQ